MADEYHVPKGVGLDTLREILAGWDAVGAGAEPQYTADVEEATGISDAVRRQTRFLEDLGVLESEGQKHRLTHRGEQLASALANGDEARAREAARQLLATWPLTEEVRGIVRGNPTDESELVDLVATMVDEDADSSRVRSGVSTLLELLEWAQLLERDSAGRYRMPEGERPRPSETPAVPAPPRPDPRHAERPRATRPTEEAVDPRAGPAGRDLSAATEPADEPLSPRPERPSEALTTVTQSASRVGPRPEPTSRELTQAVDGDISTTLEATSAAESEPEREPESEPEREPEPGTERTETAPVAAQATEASPFEASHGAVEVASSGTGEPTEEPAEESETEEPVGLAEAEAEAAMDVGADEDRPDPEAVIAEEAVDEADASENEPTGTPEQAPSDHGGGDSDGTAEQESIELDVEDVSEQLADAISALESSDGESEAGPELAVEVGDESGVDVRISGVDDLDIEEVASAIEEVATVADASGGQAQSADGAESSPADHPHALSLGIDVDADSEDLEAIVEGVRQGIVETGEDGS